MTKAPAKIKRAKSDPDDAKPNQLTVQMEKGESPGAALARKVTKPSVLSGVTLTAFRPEGVDPLPLNALVEEIREQADLVIQGNLDRPAAMLTAQAHSLDAIFNKLAARAAMNIGHYPETVEIYLKLALRAQSQCRATLETLAAIKNPPVIFAKQANISHGHQQVNNGVAAPRARETENPPNELLEKDDGQWLDARATGAAGRADPELAPVGEINRPKK